MASSMFTHRHHMEECSILMIQELPYSCSTLMLALVRAQRKSWGDSAEAIGWAIPRNLQAEAHNENSSYMWMQAQAYVRNLEGGPGRLGCGHIHIHWHDDCIPRGRAMWTSEWRVLEPETVQSKQAHRTPTPKLHIPFPQLAWYCSAHIVFVALGSRLHVFRVAGQK